MNTPPTNRPAKKRCQFKVVYNIPTKSSPPPSDSTTTSTAETSSGPSEGATATTMTANPTQCPSAALRVAGDCPHCSRVFCSTHRTPESHNCTGMQACRAAAFQANKERLEREKTVAHKIAQA